MQGKGFGSGRRAGTSRSDSLLASLILHSRERNVPILQGQLGAASFPAVHLHLHVRADPGMNGLAAGKLHKNKWGHWRRCLRTRGLSSLLD